MPDGAKYIVRGAQMKCACGTVPRKINLPLSHGFYFKGNPMMNGSDRIPETNIPFFGVCSITKVTCVPGILADWVMTKEDTLVEGKPALTTDSKLICSLGGLISFENDGQG